MTARRLTSTARSATSGLDRHDPGAPVESPGVVSSIHSGQAEDPPGAASRPEHPLEGRHLLAFTWIPDDCQRLLDAGCAWGYATREYARRSAVAVGLIR